MARGQAIDTTVGPIGGQALPEGVMMRRGRFIRSERKICIISLIRHVNRLDSRARRYGWNWSAAMDPEAAW